MAAAASGAAEGRAGLGGGRRGSRSWEEGPAPLRNSCAGHRAPRPPLGRGLRPPPLPGTPARAQRGGGGSDGTEPRARSAANFPPSGGAEVRERAAAGRSAHSRRLSRIGKRKKPSAGVTQPGG